MRIVAIVYLSVITGWQASTTMTRWVNETLPALRFVSSIDSDAPAGYTVYVPDPFNEHADFDPQSTVSKSVDVSRYAMEIGLDITHITLTFFVHATPRTGRLLVSVGEQNNDRITVHYSSSPPYGQHGAPSIARLNNDEYKEYLDAGGLTESRTREFLSSYKRRIENPGIPTIRFAD